MKQIKNVLEGVYSNLELRKSVIPLFIGKSGIGKTHIIESFAKEKGVKLVEMIASQLSPFEVSGICVPDKEKNKMVYYDFDRLIDLKDGDILFLDELLQSNPSVLSAFLTLLEQRRTISGKPLANIMIVAAANREGMCPLTPQIKERFVWYNIEFDSQMWIDYVKIKYKMPSIIATKLVSLIKNEEYMGENFYTPRSIDKAINMILKEVPTPYDSKIKPILDTPILNPFEKDVELSSGFKLQKNEMFSWLNLVKN